MVQAELIHVEQKSLQDYVFISTASPFMEIIMDQHKDPGPPTIEMRLDNITRQEAIWDLIENIADNLIDKSLIYRFCQPGQGQDNDVQIVQITRYEYVIHYYVGGGPTYSYDISKNNLLELLDLLMKLKPETVHELIRTEKIWFTDYAFMSYAFISTASPFMEFIMDENRDTDTGPTEMILIMEYVMDIEAIWELIENIANNLTEKSLIYRFYEPHDDHPNDAQIVQITRYEYVIHYYVGNGRATYSYNISKNNLLELLNLVMKLKYELK